MCDCGRAHIVQAYSLTSGKTRSCGCYRREAARQKFTRHGHCSGGKISRSYSSYRSMLRRCYDTRAINFARYGGRGVRVCKRWRESFQNFLQDMHERPEGTSLHRIRSRRNYTPSNCTWASVQRQGRQRRGVKLSVAKVRKIRCAAQFTRRELAQQFNVSPSLISQVVREQVWAGV